MFNKFLCCISLVIFTEGWMQHLISSVISADCWSRSSSMFTSADVWWIIDKVSEYAAPRICDDRAANMFYTTNIQRMTHKPTVNIKINLDEAIKADFSKTFAFLPIKTGCDDCERRLTDGCSESAHKTNSTAHLRHLKAPACLILHTYLFWEYMWTTK